MLTLSHSLRHSRGSSAGASGGSSRDTTRRPPSAGAAFASTEHSQSGGSTVRPSASGGLTAWKVFELRAGAGAPQDPVRGRPSHRSRGRRSRGAGSRRFGDRRCEARCPWLGAHTPGARASDVKAVQDSDSLRERLEHERRQARLHPRVGQAPRPALRRHEEAGFIRKVCC